MVDDGSGLLGNVDTMSATGDVHPAIAWLATRSGDDGRYGRVIVSERTGELSPASRWLMPQGWSRRNGGAASIPMPSGETRGPWPFATIANGQDLRGLAYPCWLDARVSRPMRDYVCTISALRWLRFPRPDSPIPD